MKKIINYCIISILLGVFSATLHAQTHSSYAKVDTTHILIGDHLKLQLSLTTDFQTKALFPLLTDTCIQGFEIIKQNSIQSDTHENKINFHQDIILTSFDSGVYTIPSFQFYNNDSVLLSQTSPIQITVHTLAVDTASSLIKGIKPPLKAPITLKEILYYLSISLLVIASVALIVFLFLRIHKKKPILPKAKEKPALPAHVIALQALEELRLKRLWQQGEIKAYYSELTDILRMYLENRWNIKAMEMVSFEIINALKQINTEESLINKIQYTLSHADMVKFAKGQPISDENQLSFDYVVLFVNETKLLTEESTENTKEK